MNSTSDTAHSHLSVRRYMAIPILVVLFRLLLLWLNVLATIAIARDSLSESMQRRIQFLLVWILPLIGSLVVLSVHRQDEKPSRKYLERIDPEDEITGTDIAGTVCDIGSND